MFRHRRYDRKQSEAIHCGFDASLDASKALSNAEGMAYKIKYAVGQVGRTGSPLMRSAIDALCSITG